MPTTPRSRCPVCTRPPAHCLCCHVRIVHQRTRLLVLQHPEEAQHPFNTARLAVMSLHNAECWIGERFEALPQAIAQAQYPVLLFPGEHALNIAHGSTPGNSTDHSEPCAHTPQTSTDTLLPDLLIVPDGTWRQAGRLVRENPALDAVQRVQIPEGAPSAYQIRCTHKPGAVSTLEAIVRVLQYWEPDTDFSPVEQLFKRMVSQQIAAREQAQQHSARGQLLR